MRSTLYKFLFVLVCTFASFTYAQTGFSALVIEPKTGKVIYEHNSNAARYPASVTKVMTLYIIFEELSKGRLKLNQHIKFSQFAASQEPSKLGVPAGGSITVETAIKALIVKSANDVAVAMAETISGSQANFAKRMNKTAKRLGMNNSNFVNPNGLPNPRQVTTATDLVKLGVAIYNHFPKYYKWFKTDKFVYNGQTITGHNRVNRDLPGADGIKTGYIRSSGFNLLTSAQRGNTRLFGVVLGGYSTKIRDDFMVTIMNQSFDALKKNKRNPKINPKLTEDMIVGYDKKKNPKPKAVKSTNRSSSINVAQSNSNDDSYKNSNIPTIRLLSEPQVAPNAPAAIQVGAYRNHKTAQEKARLVYRQLKKGTIHIVSGNNLYRAQLTGFNYKSATEACRTLQKNGSECVVIRK